jgi:hypothetical protein
MDERRQPDPRIEYRERMVTNLVLLAILAGIVGIGIWIADAMHAARKADECIAQGRRNCTPVDTTTR